MAGKPTPELDALTIAWRLLRAQWAAVVAARAEFAQAAALLGGWGLATLGVSRLARPDVVWPLSLGILLLALCGVQWLGRIVWEGLYQLTRRGS